MFELYESGKTGGLRIASEAEHIHYHFASTREIGRDLMLDLAKFNSLPIDLDLIVSPARDCDSPIGIETAQVSCFIEAS